MAFPYSWKYGARPGDSLQEAIHQKDSLRDSIRSVKQWSGKRCNGYPQTANYKVGTRDSIAQKRTMVADHLWFSKRRDVKKASIESKEPKQPEMPENQNGKPAGSKAVPGNSDASGEATSSNGAESMPSKSEGVVAQNDPGGTEKATSSKAVVANSNARGEAAISNGAEKKWSCPSPKIPKEL